MICLPCLCDHIHKLENVYTKLNNPNAETNHEKQTNKQNTCLHSENKQIAHRSLATKLTLYYYPHNEAYTCIPLTKHITQHPHTANPDM